ncbi:unnamed protein product [Lymnaea stagnalis]|uniref:RNA helicase n=1 Tax=Lymnaea stagnalis TaxID=6523 RepID=A0AAV2GZL0_LYMST
MASERDESISELFATIILSEDECNMPIWEHILHHNVVDSSLVNVIDSQQEQQIVKPDDENQEEYFSDQDFPSKDVPRATVVSGIPSLELRNYQRELAEKALQGLNTVICAPTGSGKTRVATHIILEHLKSRQDKKKVAFLARTVPLTRQQYKTLRKYLPNEFKVTYITGQCEDSMSLKMLIKHHDVFVMTPMVLMNNLQRTGLRLEKFTLIVFDECHHTRKDEPYNLLMFEYQKLKHGGRDKPRSNLPQIVGLTASIGFEKSRGAQGSVLELLGNLDAPYLSTVKKEKSELQAIVPVPNEYFKELTAVQPDECFQMIITNMDKLEKAISKHAEGMKNNKLQQLMAFVPKNKRTQQYEQWAVKLKMAINNFTADSQLKENKLSIMVSTTISDFLTAYNFALQTYDLVESRDMLTYLTKFFEKYLQKEDMTEEERIFLTDFEALRLNILRGQDKRNPNLRILADTLKTYLVNRGSGSRCIIFVKTRALALALTSWLNRCDIPEIRDLKASMFTGVNASGDKGGMTPANQEQILHNFSSGQTKALVATSVAEEGLDIPECNLVIKYNHIGNEITSVQTRGRSRKLGGVSILLAMADVVKKEMLNHENAKIIDKATDEVATIEISVIKQHIENQQLEILRASEEAEVRAAVRRRQSQSVQFKMRCSRCRSLEIIGADLRTIYGSYRVALDRNLLDDKHIKCRPTDVKLLDGLEIFGDVICCGEGKPGMTCGQKLGKMIKYSSIPYFATSCDKFVFCSGDKTENFKQWKKASEVYFIDELTKEDIRRYIQMGNEEVKEFGDSDEGSDSE